MRKVKDIVEEFKKSGATSEALTKAVNELLVHDIPEMKRVRTVTTVSGVLGIIATAKERFETFARLAPSVEGKTRLSPEHFGPLLQEAWPEAFALWKLYKPRNVSGAPERKETE
ncbi:MAG: hypothetical protein WCT25_01295 [Candidatus Paceibacterota bacterium]